MKKTFLLACCVSLPLGAAELLLSATQLKSHNIEIQTVGDSRVHGETLPARVTVPTAQMRVVTAPLGGVIEALLVAPGEPVKRNQTMAELASREILELQREATQAGTQSTLLRQSLERDEKLFAEGLIAESRLQATRAAAAQAAAQASERRQGLQLAGGKLSANMVPRLAVSAPIHGVVLEQLAQSGQRVEAGTPLYRLATLSPLWLEIQAPVRMASEIRPGQPLRIPDLDLGARVLSVGRLIDGGSQSVLLRAEVRQGAEKLIPGQMLSVEFPAEQAAGNASRWVIPASALVRHDTQTLVFKQDGSQAGNGDQRFVVQAVRVVKEGGDSVTVDGLKRGEMLVVRGASALKALHTGVGRE